MSTGWTRRQCLGAVAAGAVAGSLPGTAIAGAASASDAEALYRRALVLDANALASIGQVFDGPDVPQLLQQLHDSGVSALKTTLGGAAGDFETAVQDIAAAQALVDRYPQHF